MAYPDYLSLSRRIVNGGAKVNKFGLNEAVGTTYEAITTLGVYRQPQPASATPLRVKAGGNTADAPTGAGARSVVLQGINALGEFITETIPTGVAGAAGAQSARSFIRLFRCFVGASGTYANQVGTESHAADIVIENAAGTEDWATIEFGSVIAKGQSSIGCYTVPKGFTAYITDLIFSIDANKPADLLLMQRQNLTNATPPYSPRRTIEEYIGIAGTVDIAFRVPIGPFPEFTDILSYTRVTQGTAAVSIGLDIVLFNEGVRNRQITPEESIV